MSQIKIETLTPVHIGNGNFLRNKADFTVFREDGNSVIGIVDPRKILNIIGEEHLEDWILSIENPEDDIRSFIRRNSIDKTVMPRTYSRRVIMNFTENIRDADTLKECIHDGRGLPYIPGSSIKGAIRTAIVSSLAKGKDSADLERRIKRGKNGQIDKRFAAQQIENDFFGNQQIEKDDPKKDIFRFLQMGDAYFEKETEIVTRMVNLNITSRKKLVDTSKPQLIEAIGADSKSVFQMKIAKDYYQWVKENGWPLKDFPESMDALSSLFQLINAHTNELILDEIKYWKTVNEDHEGADDYIDSLRMILGNIKKCQQGKECVLRIGHGSGWRFITGAWSERLDKFEEEIVPVARPNNYRYQEYVFPKSRRLDEDGDILGFVKLSIDKE